MRGKIFSRTVGIILTALFFVVFEIYAVDYSLMSQKLDTLVKYAVPPGTDVSISVFDLELDSAIYDYRDKVLARPASVMKLITSITALSCLGTSYTFDTDVRIVGEINSDSVLLGDLYIVGDLDPEFKIEDMDMLVSKINSYGIKKIDGRVLADVTMMDSLYWGPGWCWDDTPESYQPYISPLMVNGGYVGVSAKPGKKGEAPIVNVSPESNYYSVIVSALSNTNSLGAPTITREWLTNKNNIHIKGNVTKPIAIELNIYGSAQFFIHVFRERLELQGISVDTIGMGTAPKESITIATTSRSIKEVMKEAMKESKNLNAEAMFLHLGKLRKSRDISFADASDYQETFIKRTLRSDKLIFKIADGSGLSVYNYVSSSLIVDMLRHAYKQSIIFDIICDALPVSGMDGTLRGRLGTRQTIGRIKAKTGSMTGSCSLAGFISTQNNRQLAFCIINEGVLSLSAARRLQDEICLILCQ